MTSLELENLNIRDLDKGGVGNYRRKKDKVERK